MIEAKPTTEPHMQPIIEFSREQQDVLRQFLSSSKRPEGTMNYPELAGFLFAVCSAPELIRPSECMPLVFNEQDAGYRDIDQANEVMQALMALYNWTNQGAEQRQPALPPGCDVLDEAVANLEPETDLSRWARGFIGGHNWLEELWNDLVPDELDGELGAILMVLSFFASRELATALMEESKGETGSLDEMAVSMIEILPEAMAGYAHMGRTIDEVRRAHENEGPEPPAQSVKIGRNQPCPCGSGLKYKKCCGSALH
jgi:uncharacterized protein